MEKLSSETPGRGENFAGGLGLGGEGGAEDEPRAQTERLLRSRPRRRRPGPESRTKSSSGPPGSAPAPAPAPAPSSGMVGDREADRIQKRAPEGGLRARKGHEKRHGTALWLGQEDLFALRRKSGGQGCNGRACALGIGGSGKSGLCLLLSLSASLGRSGYGGLPGRIQSPRCACSLCYSLRRCALVRTPPGIGHALGVRASGGERQSEEASGEKGGGAGRGSANRGPA